MNEHFSAFFFTADIHNTNYVKSLCGRIHSIVFDDHKMRKKITPIIVRIYVWLMLKIKVQRKWNRPYKSGRKKQNIREKHDTHTHTFCCYNLYEKFMSTLHMYFLLCGYLLKCKRFMFIIKQFIFPSFRSDGERIKFLFSF